MCETERFSRLAELPSSCFKVVKRGVVMEGYQMAVIQEWALNRARWVYRSSFPVFLDKQNHTMS